MDVEVHAVQGNRDLPHAVRVRVFQAGPRSDAPVLVLLHGSPGSHAQVRGLAERLAGQYRVLAPDLPGFGGSTPRIPDYSIRAHARYVAQVLDRLEVRSAHLLGFSLGGGVALHLAEARPDLVTSLVMLAAIGAQEYELLGDYHLNRALHGVQLAGLWLLHEAVPHFGALDGAMLSVAYARNFYDTDQRPLRGMLERWAGPMLLLHGDRDILVPRAVAEEHARIVPQAETVVLRGGHFMPFAEPDRVVSPIVEFLARVEAGTALTRPQAAPDRVAAAARPFDPRSLPRPDGFALVVLLVLLAAATLVSEDLACIGAGILVGRGTLAFFPATAACLAGIAVGDLLLFLLGRGPGRTLLRRAPLRWFVSPADVARSSAWFRRRGLPVVFTTRFLPGTRLPTYVAAGMMHTSLPRFAAAFLLAAAVWTPLLVGGSALVGQRALAAFGSYGQFAAPAFLVTLLVLWLLTRLGTSLATWRGRRLLLSRWRRLTRWEFWPPWAVYPPVVLYILALGLRHRSLTLFTCANPAMPGGGLVGESKGRILEGLKGAGNRVAPAALVPAGESLAARRDRVREFMAAHGLSFPVVLKPDVGERGRGVGFAASEAEVERYLADAVDDVLCQAHVAGEEFGIFYYRMPGEPRGRIFAVTEKRFPEVVGDGRRTLEQLILADDRAVCLARQFLALHAARLDQVPAPGRRVGLTGLGTHSRGAVFHDGARHLTPALEREVDSISQTYEGFWFGRYDLRAPSAEALRAGGPFTVIELNGVSSEATSMYDPRYGLWRAWRTLFAQWRLAFAIGARNRSAGARPATLRALLSLLRRHRRATRAHVPT